jgi:hypothetical protein
MGSRVITDQRARLALPYLSQFRSNATNAAADVGHAEVDGGRLGRTVAHGLQLLGGGGQSGLDRSDLAEPAMVLGLLVPIDEVGVDLAEAWHLGRVHEK